MSKGHANNLYLLDKISQRDIRLSKQRYDSVAKYYWDHYSYFAHQRSLILDDLKNALLKSSRPLLFSHWQRVVDYKFSTDPLSAKGSILNDPGGRFNIGNLDETRFPKFAALYFAEERETAYKEKFGLYREIKVSGLTADDLAFTNLNSVSIIVVRGELTGVLDLTNINSLKGFFELIKSIHLPKNFIKRARQLNLESPMRHVESLTELTKTILLPNWRNLPMQVDIPSNSQILGQIAYAAGIEAILYPSKMTNKNCLAIFPKNFEKSASYIELEGDIPKEVKNLRLDCATYSSFI